MAKGHGHTSPQTEACMSLTGILTGSKQGQESEVPTCIPKFCSILCPQGLQGVCVRGGSNLTVSQSPADPESGAVVTHPFFSSSHFIPYGVWLWLSEAAFLSLSVWGPSPLSPRPHPGKVQECSGHSHIYFQVDNGLCILDSWEEQHL